MAERLVIWTVAGNRFTHEEPDFGDGTVFKWWAMHDGVLVVTEESSASRRRVRHYPVVQIESWEVQVV